MIICEDVGFILFFFAWKLYIELIVYWPIQLLISMAGGQRPPLLDYDLLVLGGRPKAALADERLIAAHSFSKACGPWYTKLHQLLLHLRLNHGCATFI